MLVVVGGYVTISMFQVDPPLHFSRFFAGRRPSISVLPLHFYGIITFLSSKKKDQCKVDLCYPYSLHKPTQCYFFMSQPALLPGTPMVLLIEAIRQPQIIHFRRLAFIMLFSAQTLQDNHQKAIKSTHAVNHDKSRQFMLKKARKGRFQGFALYSCCIIIIDQTDSWPGKLRTLNGLQSCLCLLEGAFCDPCLFQLINNYPTFSLLHQSSLRPTMPTSHKALHNSTFTYADKIATRAQIINKIQYFKPFPHMRSKPSTQSFARTQRKKSFAKIVKAKSAHKSQEKEKAEKIVYMRISDEEEGVHIPFSIWSETVKKVIKDKGGTWCPVFKIWKVHRVRMEFVRKQLDIMFPDNYETPPYFIQMVAAEPKQPIIYGVKIVKMQYDIADHPLFSKLYPFQRESLAFCQERYGRILIADEMGVGKSIQSLACSVMYSNLFPLLIICPSALKYVWRDEVSKWLKGIIHPDQILLIKKGTLAPKQLGPARVIITSYQIASKLTHELQKIQIVICDEAHYLKNPDTNRCEQLVPFLSQKQKIFLLTGTPALAKPRQLFNLLRILRPDIFKSFEHFGERYCVRRYNPWNSKWQFEGAKNLAELHYVLKKTVMIRRLKEDVLPQLPPKQRQIIYMQTEKSVIGEIKDLLGSSISVQNIRSSEKIMHMFFDKGLDKEEKERENSEIMRCYLLSGLAKIQSVKDYVTSILQNDVKIIIFAHHKIIMDQLDQHLKGLKMQYIRLDGDCSSQTRKKKVDHFQNEFSVRAALLSITAMGTGFTLTAASTVIFAELHWTPANLIQAEDRTHRIGQKRSVNIHYLIGDKTLDPLMLRQLERKIETVGKLLNATTDSLNMEVVEQGNMGNFEIAQQEDNHPKGSKITDYFAPALKNVTQSESREEQAQQQTKEKVIEVGSQSQDSMIFEIIRKKRQQAQSQGQ